ncbi:hypothetical protein M918_15530 [Clostridium sp. BL8]|uniref:alpha/beta fold hydrolase n=1 Tax=Clostridium sp. BL8 TaxID=1354301 RepID=UPI00038A0698|nr:alpha/beta fold hydrolase [Clostridium sp. BL8]EQB86125.1 hypothetical protein M918_15530 [Clostridium sp. BL8]
MKEIFINKDYNKARIHQWGDKEDPTIICFHGLGGTSLSFIELGYLLRREYNVIAIDLPGHGKTPAFEREEDYEMPNMVTWIDKVISTITEKKNLSFRTFLWCRYCTLLFIHLPIKSN